MNTFLAVFNVFPVILASVQAVEAAIPMPNAGQQKLNLVLGAATTAWEITQVGEQMNESNLLTAVTAMTNLAVAGLNAAGVFGTTQPATATGTPATPTPATAPAPVSSN
jgi:hypothetical protein